MVEIIRGRGFMFGVGFTLLSLYEKDKKFYFCPFVLELGPIRIAPKLVLS